jgi:hypothetical protein
MRHAVMAIHAPLLVDSHTFVEMLNLAKKKGNVYLEANVRRAADDVLLAHHMELSDLTLVRDLTIAELRRKVGTDLLTLGESLDLFREGMGKMGKLILDIQDEESTGIVIHEISKREMQSSVLITSDLPTVISALNKTRLQTGLAATRLLAFGFTGSSILRLAHQIGAKWLALKAEEMVRFTRPVDLHLLVYCRRKSLLRKAPPWTNIILMHCSLTNAKRMNALVQHRGR